MNRMIVSAAAILAMGIGAAQAQNQDTQMRQQAQQQGQQQQAENPGTEVLVDQGGADVNVQQPSPDVKVIDPEPRVKVDVPKPEVQVTQPKPEVIIDQGEPDVDVQKAGQADVTIVEKDMQQAQGEVQQDQMQQQTAAAPSPMELEDKKVFAMGGEEIGEVEDILVGTNGQVEAIVIVRGGFLGMGEEERVVSIDKVRVNDQGVMLDMNKDQVAQLPKYEGQGQQGQQPQQTQ